MVSFGTANREEMKNEKIEQIYNRYLSRMLAITRKIVHNMQDVDDALQEALVKILINIDRYDPVDCDRTAYNISIVTRNAAIKVRRGQKIDRLVPLSEWEDNLDDMYWEKLEIAEKMDIVYKALRTIEPNLRDVLYLFYQNEMTIPEIASMLNEKPDIIKQRYNRGMRQLKKLVQNDEEDGQAAPDEPIDRDEKRRRRYDGGKT